MNCAVPSDNLPGLVLNKASNAVSESIKKLERIIREKGAVRAGKGFTLFMSNEDKNDIIKIVKSLEFLVVLIDGDTEAVIKETKKFKTVHFLLLCLYRVWLLQWYNLWFLQW